MEKIIINIGRQFASGGRYISKKLCEDFGCKFFDKEILDLAAKESGFSPDVFKKSDEKKSFVHTLFHLHAPMLSDDNFYNNKFSEESLFKFQCDAIQKAASQGNCLFIGRCADYVLRDEPNTVSIFLAADMKDRISRTMERYNMDEESARKTISKKDNTRASYYNYYTGKKWGAAESYDLCINTSIFGLDETAEFIADFIRKR
ncbi:MAG: cytidylate kinase-like family protein [Prevotella sp.]|nr:cytidylate kinase-like family protein [Prevotella sp.]